MFIWRVSRIMEEFARQMPPLRTVLDSIADAWGTSNQEAELVSAWAGLNVETIDYGVMEHAEKVAVLPAGGLDWSDVGSWDSLFDVLIPDQNGNIVVNSHAMPLDTHNTIIYGSDKKLIVTIGLDGLVIVDTDDAMLVCRKDQAQQVRQVIANLKNSDRKHYL
jgi:mannose-1-phosphate guanylyltransferase